MKYKDMAFVSVLLFLFVLTPNPMASEAETIATTATGITGGLFWSYNDDLEKTHDSSVDYSDSAVFQKDGEVNNTFDLNLPVIVGMERQDFYYNRYINTVATNGNDSLWELEKGWGRDGAVGNKTGNLENIFTIATNAYYRYEWLTINHFPPKKAEIGLLGGQVFRGLAGGNLAWWTTPQFGFALAYEWYTTNVTVEVVGQHSVPSYDWLQQQYGTLTVDEVLITYLFDEDGTPSDLTDDRVVLKEKLVPQFEQVRVQTQLYPVTVEQSSVTHSSLEASYNFTGTYEGNQKGAQVVVSDAKDYIFSWYGAKEAYLEYEHIGGFTLDGTVQWVLTNDITFDNGTVVPEAVRPWWARSSNMSLSGRWSHSYEDAGAVYGKGTFQSLVQAIRTRASTNVSEQLAVWANLIPGTMFGYYDKDNSGDVSIRLNGSSLEVMDEVMAIGLTHGLTANRTYDATNAVSASTYWKLGPDTLLDANVDETGTVNWAVEETQGVNPNSELFNDADATMAWVAPTLDSGSGEVTFSWSMDYTDFPVMWYARNSTTVYPEVVEMTDISHDYTLVVNPSAGSATLSRTYTTSGITNTTLNQMLEGLGMATYKHDLFLSMSAVDDVVDPTEATLESNVSSTIGGELVVDQLFGGSKQAYTLTNGSSYDSQVTVVNVITADGSTATGEANVDAWSPFASSFLGRKTALSLLQWTADNHTQGVDWDFRENIVVTAYPTWSGQGITHDPDATVYYAPTVGSVDTTESGDTTTDSSGTGETSTETTGVGGDETTTADAGWGLIAVMTVLVVSTVVGWKKRQY